MFSVYYFPTFKDEAKKILTPHEKELVDKYINKNLVPNGDTAGDQISYEFFREFKLKGKRVYFLVYKNIAIILLVSSSKNKKDQQKKIDNIKENLELYKKYAYTLYEIKKKS